jgi:hypothetical protein
MPHQLEYVQLGPCCVKHGKATLLQQKANYKKQQLLLKLP